MLFGDLAYISVRDELALAERAPGFGGDTKLLMSLLRRLLLEIGMQLDLVDDGNDAGFADDTLEMFRIEIRHADRAGATLFPDAHESLPGLGIKAAMRRRPVNEIEVDIFGTELLQAAVEGAQRIVIALIGIPELGGDEDVLAVEAGRTDAFADALFVVVTGSRIDVTIVMAAIAVRTVGAAISCGVCQTPRPTCGMECPSWKVMIG